MSDQPFAGKRATWGDVADVFPRFRRDGAAAGGDDADTWSPVMLGLLTRDGEVALATGRRVPLGPVRAEVRGGRVAMVNAEPVEFPVVPPPEGVEVVAVGVFDGGGRLVRRADIPARRTEPLTPGEESEGVRRGFRIGSGKLSFVMEND